MLERQVIAASNIPAGKEIENTYGELGNAELVNKYGFALRQNPFSVVQLDKTAVVEAARQQAGKGMTERAFRRRKRFLEDERSAAAHVRDSRCPRSTATLQIFCSEVDIHIGQVTPLPPH